jgi:hypothetical protein
MFGTGNFTRLGTSNRTAGALLVGAGGSRTGAGSLSRVYNWCHQNSTDVLACTFGASAPGPASLVAWVASTYNNNGEGHPLLYGSRDGTTWEPCATQPFSEGFVCSIAYGNNVWVAGCVNQNFVIGENVSIVHSLAYSYDVLNWKTVQNDPFTGTKAFLIGCFSIAFADGLFVAAGASEAGTTLVYSHDGVIWSPSPQAPGQGAGQYGFSIVYGGGTWLFGYADFNTRLFYTSFSNQPSSSGSWSTPLTQNIDGQIVNVFPTNTAGQYAWFNQGIQLLQTNSVSQPFTEVTDFSSFSNVARGVIGNETSLVIVSKDDEYLYTSSDGANGTWSQRFSLSKYGIDCLLYGNNVWVAAGDGLFYSDDKGVTWINTNISDVDFNNIAFNGKEWQAYNSTNKMYYSQDGKVWNETFSFDQPIITIQSKLPGTILAFPNNFK